MDGPKKKITAIVGTYRRGGIVDSAVDEILASAREGGAETAKIYLLDRHIEFCRNCRDCMQLEGAQRGRCALEDDMGAVLEEVEKSDALVIASPMNFGTVTALMKRFLERLVCFAYWPWGKPAPRARSKRKSKAAVVVASSAAPAIIARISSKIVKQLKEAAGLLGAKTVGVLFIGLAALAPRQELSSRLRKKARRLGKRLAG